MDLRWNSKRLKEEREIEKTARGNISTNYAKMSSMDFQA